MEHTVLDAGQWRHLAQTHKEKVYGLLSPFLMERDQNKKNPVLDFLFKYYRFRPAQLARWTPGPGVLLLNGQNHQAFRHKDFIKTDEGTILDPSRFPSNRVGTLHWIYRLFRGITSRQPRFNCCGMHEWAMVYKTGEIRHAQFPLRMGQADINGFVESMPLQCTHFDAFRFFTEPAKPMNAIEPSRQSFPQNEQPGCLHTNMDLYKWSYKLYPWIPSDIMMDAFLLALKARELDMRAGPYDLSGIGYEAIPIETSEGRIQYKELQAEIWKETMPIREKMTQVMGHIIEHSKTNKTCHEEII